MRGRRFAVLLSIIILIIGGGIFMTENFMNSHEKITFTNPIKESGADPWVINHDGYYYSCYAKGNNSIYIGKAERLEEVYNESSAKKVWQSPPGKEYLLELWAPELHYLNGKWYIYFAADTGKNENHRMFCIEGTSDDPQGEYIFKNKLSVEDDRWAIDGTVLDKGNGELYFIWSGWEGSKNVSQNIYIAKMSNPFTLTGERVKISVPEESWETNGTPLVNEGPEVLIKNGVIHIAYSASGSWTDDYCLGLLTCKDGDVMNQNSWEKTGSVFSKTEEVYGPGHCSFTKSPDGKEDWIIYHANRYSGTGWDGRSVRMQKFTWDNNYPVFGKPVKTGEVIEAPSGTK